MDLGMRQLGRALGVEAMSLYHLFPSKVHLLDAAADRPMVQVIVPQTPSAATWRDWLTAVAVVPTRRVRPATRLSPAGDTSPPVARRRRPPARQHRGPSRCGLQCS